MTNEYHERIQKLVEATRQLTANAQQFAATIGITDVVQPTIDEPMVQPDVDPVQAMSQFENVQKESTNVADLISDVDLDDLLKSVSTQDKSMNL